MDPKSKQQQREKAQISHELKRLEIQHSRALSGTHRIHDADFYMVMVRRLYRHIEKGAKNDSAVANLKGKYNPLCEKIKIRDDFEHSPKEDAQTDKEALGDLGLIDKDSPLNIRVQTSIIKNSIISGSWVWDLDRDHEDFCDMMEKYLKML